MVGPVLAVGRVAVGHHGVEAVVAAEPLEHHEDPSRRVARRGPARLREHLGHGARAAEEAEADTAGAQAQHVAPRHAGVA